MNLADSCACMSPHVSTRSAALHRRAREACLQRITRNAGAHIILLVPKAAVATSSSLKRLRKNRGPA